MSYGGHTRDDDTSCLFRTYVGPPDGSWPQSYDGASLAGAGSEVGGLCSDRSQTSYVYCAT